MRVSPRLTIQLINVFVLTLSLFLFGCGSGETTPATTGTGDTGTGITPSAPIVLSWTPPESFADQTPLDPARDLAHYEIYINETGNFASTEPSDADVSAVDSAGGGLVTSFDMANLAPFLSPNVTYYVSMKSVSVTGVKSDFSPPASFTL